MMSTLNVFSRASIAAVCSLFLVAACSSSSSSSTAGNDDDGGSVGHDSGTVVDGGSQTDSGGSSIPGSGSGPGSATATGSVGSATLTPLSAIARYGAIITDAEGSSDGGSATTYTRGLALILSNKANDCSTYHGADTTTLQIDVVGEPVSPGSFAIISGTPTAGEGFAGIETTNATCGHSFIQGPTSGTLTIATITDTVISGSFDITFPSGTVSGTFEATHCSDLANGAPPPACME